MTEMNVPGMGLINPDRILLIFTCEKDGCYMSAGITVREAMQMEASDGHGVESLPCEACGGSLLPDGGLSLDSLDRDTFH